MTTKEWAIPLAIGLVAGVGLWALAAGSDGGDGHDDGAGGHSGGTTTGEEPPQPLLLPFDGSLGPPGENTTFLLLAPLGRAAAEERVNQSSGTHGFPDQTNWQGDRLALYTAPNLFAGCQESPPGSGQRICSDPVWVFGDWPLPRARALPDNDTGPRLLHGGHNATRVTAYVFDEAGELLASNANDTARFTLHGDFVRLPSSAWYLGANATAPNGTSHLPGFAKPLVDRVRPQLDGLPVGGVASVRSNAYAALYGSLFVTVRVDGLVLAP